jgi:hypothetical protein
MAKTTKRNSMNNMNTITKTNGGYNMQKTNNAYVPNSNKYEVYQANNKVAKILAGTAKLDDITDVKDKVIDFNKCLRKIKMIQTIYSAGSQVGACTVVAGNMVSFILTEETQDAFKKALKYLDERDTHETYKSVWVEGVNKFTFKFADGFFYVYYVVTNDEMELLKQRIEAMDYNRVTLEELKQLQNDLAPFVRAWQESSIDVSKDKTKVFNYSFSDFFSKIEVVSTFMKNNRENITTNFAGMKKLHKAGRKEDMEFRITLPHGQEVYQDLVGFTNYRIAEAVEKYLNGSLLSLYKGASKEYYEQFADACLAHEELALFISRINVIVAQAKQEDVKITKEQYALMRNAIYTKAAAYNVPVEEVVKVAVAVAMRTVKQVTKDGKTFIEMGASDIARFQDSKVYHIFPQEFEVLRTNKPVTETLNVIYVEENTVIAEGDEVEFNNGVSVDGTVEVEELFTGVAYNDGGKLVYDVDVYAYEETNAVITMETAGAESTSEKRVSDNGEMFAEYLAANDHVIITGQTGNVLVSSDKRTILAKVTNSKELMPTGKARVYTIADQLSFEPKVGTARVFMLVLSK